MKSLLFVTLVLSVLSTPAFAASPRTAEDAIRDGKIPCAQFRQASTNPADNEIASESDNCFFTKADLRVIRSHFMESFRNNVASDRSMERAMRGTVFNFSQKMQSNYGCEVVAGKDLDGALSRAVRAGASVGDLIFEVAPLIRCPF